MDIETKMINQTENKIKIEGDETTFEASSVPFTAVSSVSSATISSISSVEVSSASFSTAASITSFDKQEVNN